MKNKYFTIFMIIALLLVGLVPAAGAAPAINDEPELVPREDNLPDPLTAHQLELKQQALEAKLNGKAFGKTHEVARGQYVELALEGKGAIWTVLGEFADLHHNSIPAPDRTVDNTTLWVSDFNRQHFKNLFFNETRGANSMVNFYLEQSSGRYKILGDVTDWIPVPNNAVYYDDNPDSNVWFFLQDTVNGWYASQVAAGKTTAEINAYLSQFDVWDRYDYDGDGNFNEPDGYIDTFQSVHSGEGEEAGGGALGAEAIWSHSWYAQVGS